MLEFLKIGYFNLRRFHSDNRKIGSSFGMGRIIQIDNPYPSDPESQSHTYGQPLLTHYSQFWTFFIVGTEIISLAGNMPYLPLFQIGNLFLQLFSGELFSTGFSGIGFGPNSAGMISSG